MSNSYIKVRFAGEKRFWFEDPTGVTTNLRVHAAHYPDVESAINKANIIREFGAVKEVRVYAKNENDKFREVARMFA